MKRKIIPYNPKLKNVARMLRKNMTLSEIILWYHLKGKKMRGYDFHRQKPLGNFIVDFYCNELSLAIEIDGESHDYRIGKDVQRQKQLESLGVNFLRFDDLEVKKNLAGVLTAIEDWIIEYEKNTPRLLRIHPYDDR